MLTNYRIYISDDVTILKLYTILTIVLKIDANAKSMSQNF